MLLVDGSVELRHDLPQRVQPMNITFMETARNIASRQNTTGGFGKAIEASLSSQEGDRCSPKGEDGVTGFGRHVQGCGPVARECTSRWRMVQILEQRLADLRQEKDAARPGGIICGKCFTQNEGCEGCREINSGEVNANRCDATTTAKVEKANMMSQRIKAAHSQGGTHER